MAAMKGATSGPDLAFLRQVTRNLVKGHLEEVSGKKPFDLIMDGSLMRPLDRLVQGASFFKDNGAQRIFKLEETMRGDMQRIYVVRPTVANIRLIIGHVTAAVARQRTDPDALPMKTTVLFVPRKSYVCEKILEEEGVYGHVIIMDLKLDFIPFDDDLISMEQPLFFSDVFLDRDFFWLHSAASGLAFLQRIFGDFSNFIFVGKAAQDVGEICASLTASTASNSAAATPATTTPIQTAIVFDRNLDLVTPMLTQITYEGMLDETYGISCGMIEFPEEVTQKKSATKMLLTNEDPIYKEVRNRHFTNVFGFLKHKAKDLQAKFEDRHDIKTVGEMKDFVGNTLKNLKTTHKALEVHISACENIITKATGPDGEIEERLKAEHEIVDGALDSETFSHLEDHLALQTDELKSLRLMCLCSAVGDGLAEKDYSRLKAQFLQAHGFDHLPLFHSLKKVGLFCPNAPAAADGAAGLDRQTSYLSGASFKGAAAAAARTPFFGAAKSSNFFKLSAKLKLVPKERENVDLKNPTSMNYIYSGAYAPLSCRVVEELITRGYDASKEILDLLGPHGAKIGATSARPTPVLTARGESTPTHLVFFLGGVTFAEIAALRFLGKVRGVRFIVAATAIVNGHTLIESIAGSA